MPRLFLHSFLVSCFLNAAAFAAKPPVSCGALMVRPNPAVVTIASLNVENNFDTVDDRATDDQAFLPAGRTITSQGARGKFRAYDWNRSKMHVKLTNLQKLFGEYGHVDAMSAIEVESELSTGPLAQTLGFEQFAMSRSLDSRGMDVASLYSESEGFSLTYFYEHPVKLVGHATRNILEMGFLVNGKQKLVLFTVHFPSQHNPPADRVFAAKILKDAIDARMQEYPDARIVAMGDFNTLVTDSPNAIADVLLKDGGLVDVETAFRADPSIAQSLKDSLPPGSYYYDKTGEWNNFDHLFVSKNALEGKGLALDLSTFRIVAPKFASKTATRGGKQFLVPKRYDFDATVPGDSAGYSDHYGLKVSFIDHDFVPSASAQPQAAP